jgi:hypothetical protein
MLCDLCLCVGDKAGVTIEDGGDQRVMKYKTIVYEARDSMRTKRRPGPAWSLGALGLSRVWKADVMPGTCRVSTLCGRRDTQCAIINSCHAAQPRWLTRRSGRALCQVRKVHHKRNKNIGDRQQD